MYGYTSNPIQLCYEDQNDLYLKAYICFEWQAIQIPVEDKEISPSPSLSHSLSPMQQGLKPQQIARAFIAPPQNSSTR